jgi:hypothetical protein
LAYFKALAAFNKAELTAKEAEAGGRPHPNAILIAFPGIAERSGAKLRFAARGSSSNLQSYTPFTITIIIIIN